MPRKSPYITKTYYLEKAVIGWIKEKADQDKRSDSAFLNKVLYDMMSAESQNQSQSTT